MKKVMFLSISILLLISSAFTQNNPPVAVNDTFTVMNEIETYINVLVNDYDPDGDTIMIRGGGGSYAFKPLIENDSVLRLQPKRSFVGLDSLRYWVREINNPTNLFIDATVYLNVLENPDVPIAKNDTFYAISEVPIDIDFLTNDFDLNGDQLTIDDIDFPDYGSYDMNDEGTAFIYTPDLVYEEVIEEIDYIVKELTDEQYFSNEATITIIISPNPNIPIAYEDEGNVVAGSQLELFVLDNDIDPNGDEIEIYEFRNTGNINGELTNNGNSITYTPHVSFTGEITFKYNVRKTNSDILLYSNYAEVTVNVSKNPDCPIGEADELTATYYSLVEIPVLNNDLLLNNGGIIIKDAYLNTSLLESELSYNNYSIYYKASPVADNPDTIYYRIAFANNPELFSEYIPVSVNLTQNFQLPFAYNDSASVIAGDSVVVKVLLNDKLLDVTNYEIYIGNINNDGHVRKTDSTITFTPYKNFSGLTKITYYIMDWDFVGRVAKADVIINVTGIKNYTEVDLNNIKASVNASGVLFNKIRERVDGQGIRDYEYGYEYPKGSGHHTMFIQDLWIGGFDQSNNFYFSGEFFAMGGRDIQVGPVSLNYDHESLKKWDRLWKLDKTQIQEHRDNWQSPNYEPIEDIASWPGNGDVDNGQTELLAPFYDLNSNDVYEPMLGDYPLIRGDQCVYFINNDDMKHSDSRGDSLKIEIHGMVYAIEPDEYDVLDNTIFVHYDITNKSDNDYLDVYMGMMTDFSIGYTWDDYVGCNVQNGSYYGYNGTAIDGNGQPEAYGENPPVQAVMILAGPYMDNDNIDNEDGGCDYSINGLNFANSIVDDERLGLTSFVTFNNDGTVSGNPYEAPDQYNYMRNWWRDNRPIEYGGTGHVNSPNTVGPECLFMYPGNSDPCNWGTNGVAPNGGYNQDSMFWTEENENNTPSNRRGLGIMGPFTFEAGETQQIDLAYVTGESLDTPMNSVNNLMGILDEIREKVLDGEFVINTENLSLEELEISKVDYKIYPNPSNGIVHINNETNIDIISINIYNILGKRIKHITSGSDINQINISDLYRGVYLIEIINKDGFAVTKKLYKL